MDEAFSGKTVFSYLLVMMEDLSNYVYLVPVGDVQRGNDPAGIAVMVRCTRGASGVVSNTKTHVRNIAVHMVAEALEDAQRFR